MACVGVCSWSLRPRSPRDLVAQLAACGVDAVQLALDPVRDGRWDEAETVDALAEAGVTVRSGMMGTAGEDYTTMDSIRRTGGVRPDATWPANLQAARENAALAARMGLPLVTLHAGFIPHEPTDPERATLIDRLRQVVDAFADHGVRIGFETGQESAATLLDALDELDRPDAGVNFDPANMILYAMGDPVAALADLAPRVVQLHVKDATPAAEPGAWGAEVPAGEGAVDWAAFFRVVGERLRDRDLIVEREAGDRRVEDVARAVAMVRQHAVWAGRP